MAAEAAGAQTPAWGASWACGQTPPEEEEAWGARQGARNGAEEDVGRTGHQMGPAAVVAASLPGTLAAGAGEKEDFDKL